VGAEAAPTEHAHLFVQAAEAEMVRLFELASHCARHANRVTLQPKDLMLVRLIRGDNN
jgi:histone H3/H4